VGPPTNRDCAAVLGRVQVLRTAPPLRAPSATWTRPARGSCGQLSSAVHFEQVVIPTTDAPSTSSSLTLIQDTSKFNIDPAPRAHFGSLSTLPGELSRQACRPFSPGSLRPASTFLLCGIRHGIGDCALLPVHLERRHKPCCHRPGARAWVPPSCRLARPAQTDQPSSPASGPLDWATLPRAGRSLGCGVSSHSNQPPWSPDTAADAGTLLRSGCRNDTSPLGGCCPITAVPCGEPSSRQQLLAI
jgi:hypothetical protein